LTLGFGVEGVFVAGTLLLEFGGALEATTEDADEVALVDIVGVAELLSEIVGVLDEVAEG